MNNPAPSDHVARIQQQWRRERPDIDVAPQGILGRLHRLASALSTEIVEVYQRYGLSEGEFDVLATLRRGGDPFECAPSDLARHTMVTTGGMSKRLDRLEAAGYLTRRSSASDARRRVVALTAAGRILIDDAFTAHMENERMLVSELSDADRLALEGILGRWLARYESD